jgi:hypothetical protein
MTKSINKEYKFVFFRNDQYDRSFDGKDFSAMRAKYPKFVIANKTPCKYTYYSGVRASEFFSLYMRDYSKSNLSSMTEAEWTTHILTYNKQHLAKLRKELREAQNIEGIDSYYAQVRKMLIPIYEQEVKNWKQKHKQLADQGVYTYLELKK